MSVSGVVLVKDASLVKVQTIKEKFINQLPWLETQNRFQELNPEKVQVIGLLNGGLVIFQDVNTGKVYRASLTQFIRWKGFKDTTEVIEGFRNSIPQLFYT